MKFKIVDPFKCNSAISIIKLIKTHVNSGNVMTVFLSVSLLLTVFRQIDNNVPSTPHGC